MPEVVFKTTETFTYYFRYKIEIKRTAYQHFAENRKTYKGDSLSIGNILTCDPHIVWEDCKILERYCKTKKSFLLTRLNLPLMRTSYLRNCCYSVILQIYIYLIIFAFYFQCSACVYFYKKHLIFHKTDDIVFYLLLP